MPRMERKYKAEI